MNAMRRHFIANAAGVSSSEEQKPPGSPGTHRETAQGKIGHPPDKRRGKGQRGQGCELHSIKMAASQALAR